MRKYLTAKNSLLAAAFVAAVSSLLFLTIPDTASKEYRYTIKQIYRFAGQPCLWALPLILAYMFRGAFNKANLPLILGALGTGCVLAPCFSPNVYDMHWAIGVLYSVLWAFGSVLLCVSCFMLSARGKGFFSGLCSVCGAIFLLWGAAEIYYLATPQALDGQYNVSNQSRHVLNNEAQADWAFVRKNSGMYPVTPAHPSHSVGAAWRRYNTPLYDVKYTLDEYGHRITALNPETPEADLLLFGCSFVFGHGLENEQTWAWKLSKDLGPSWRVVNYAFNGFGAQQMLAALEENELEPLPRAEKREALFLGIKDHLLRFTGIKVYRSRQPRYTYKGGRLERAGFTTESPLQMADALSFYLNGSQAARALSASIEAGYFKRRHDELLAAYAAIIVRSSRLLKDKLGARLTVMLWPGIEEAAPLLEKEGIPVLLAQDFLPSYTGNGLSYHIVPHIETHPNEKAANELAAGLADYYRRVLRAE